MMASNWTEVELGEVIEIFDSKRIPLSSKERSSRQGKYPYYGASGVIDHIDDYIFDGEYLLIAEDGENLNSRKLPVAFWAKGKFWVNNHAHIILGKEKKASTEFIRLWFAQANISGYITGAAQPKLSQGNLKIIKLSLPEFEEQEKIADVLSSYDNLIENNNRRIAILEEIAQSLYREWFVNFRFPGHQNTKFIDSPLGKIPEGWEVVTLESICGRITDGAHKSPKSVDDGMPMASVKDMHNFGLDISTCRKIESADYDDLVKNDCKVNGGDILIAKDGANLTKHCFVVEKDLDVVLLSSIAILRPKENTKPHLLAYALKDPSIKKRLDSYVSGVAIPRIVLKDFRKFQIIFPPEALQNIWNDAVEPMVKFCWNLTRKVQSLKLQRDLLLPKLISGKINI